jgi:hypothetical protein
VGIALSSPIDQAREALEAGANYIKHYAASPVSPEAKMRKALAALDAEPEWLARVAEMETALEEIAYGSCRCAGLTEEDRVFLRKITLVLEDQRLPVLAERLREIASRGGE